MVKFKEINYQESLNLFRQADHSGKRLRLGDFTTSQWLQKENINLYEIKTISSNYPDLKIFIIGEGESEGFYIYSQKQETCFKFEAELSY
ncbi:hypothetical protein [uncultured Sunxiuqinia sp.]|uniref:hypothetical protein n=1 Tax=uncultured Sunxiuqinia sp. TaxID=1573825 RepID=UPI002AA66336|nr:hypothetical protein [uncultured Sunxiuqinia sp.]